MIGNATVALLREEYVSVGTLVLQELDKDRVKLRASTWAGCVWDYRKIYAKFQIYILSEKKTKIFNFSFVL